jgi:hypothetical protein
MNTRYNRLNVNQTYRQRSFLVKEDVLFHDIIILNAGLCCTSTAAIDYRPTRYSTVRFIYRHYVVSYYQVQQFEHVSLSFILFILFYQTPIRDLKLLKNSVGRCKFCFGIISTWLKKILVEGQDIHFLHAAIIANYYSERN